MAEPAPPPSPQVALSPFACRLALKLTEETFGPVCRQAIACLVGHGTQQYGELLRASGLSPRLLRNALLVLIQHNYINCYLKEEPPTLRGPGPTYSLYEVALPRILQSLRVPRFLTHISDEHGHGSVRLVCNLIEHGRLRWDQLMEAVSSEVVEQGGEEAAAPDPDMLLNQFRLLVIERYIERVPPCTLPPPAQQVHPSARKKKAAPKPGSEEEAELHREQQEAAMRQEYQQVRFQLLEELVSLTHGAAEIEAPAKPAGKRKCGKEPIAGSIAEPAKKRGRRNVGTGGSGGTSVGDGDNVSQLAQTATAGDMATVPVLWRVNYDEFNRRFRNDVVASIVKFKHGIPAGQAVEGLLLANARFEQTARAGETVVLSVSDVSGALRRAYGNEGVPNNVGGILSELAEDEMAFLDSRGSGPGGEQFVLNIPRVLGLARLLQLQGVIRSKFGPHGMRIWRLLLLSGQLEQKQVADLAMVTKEEAREALYAMLKAGYLALQDVPRTNDRAPSRTFYTWRANADATIARMATDLYRAAGNLHARLAHEVAEHNEVLELLELPSVAQTAMDRRQTDIKKVKDRVYALEASLLSLDSQTCLFSDI